MTEIINSFNFVACIFISVAYLLIAGILDFLFKGKENKLLKTILIVCGILVILYLLAFLIVQFDVVNITEAIIIVMFMLCVLLSILIDVMHKRKQKKKQNDVMLSKDSAQGSEMFCAESCYFIC